MSEGLATPGFDLVCSAGLSNLGTLSQPFGQGLFPRLLLFWSREGFSCLSQQVGGWRRMPKLGSKVGRSHGANANNTLTCGANTRLHQRGGNTSWYYRILVSGRFCTVCALPRHHQSDGSDGDIKQKMPDGANSSENHCTVHYTVVGTHRQTCRHPVVVQRAASCRSRYAPCKTKLDMGLNNKVRIDSSKVYLTRTPDHGAAVERSRYCPAASTPCPMVVFREQHCRVVQQ